MTDISQASDLSLGECVGSFARLLVVTGECVGTLRRAELSIVATDTGTGERGQGEKPEQCVHSSIFGVWSCDCQTFGLKVWA